MLAEAHESLEEKHRQMLASQSQLMALQGTSQRAGKAIEIMKVKDERLDWFEKEVKRLRDKLLSLANTKGDNEALKKWLSDERATHDRHQKETQKLCGKLTKDVAEADRRAKQWQRTAEQLQDEKRARDAADVATGRAFCEALVREIADAAMGGGGSGGYRRSSSADMRLLEARSELKQFQGGGDGGGGGGSSSWCCSGGGGVKEKKNGRPSPHQQLPMIPPMRSSSSTMSSLSSSTSSGLVGGRSGPGTGL